jgi:choline dehydrogenase-like flavoprotein
LTISIVIVGAGIGGICAAIAAGRLRRRVVLIESGQEIGGTGVHTSVSLVCKFKGTNGKVINNGIHRELFPQAYIVGRGLFGDDDDVPTYDEQELQAAYLLLLNKEPFVTVWTDSEVTAVHTDRQSSTKGGALQRILGVDIRKGSGKQVKVSGDVFLDATADGNLSAMAGAQFQHAHS